MSLLLAFSLVCVLAIAACSGGGQPAPAAPDHVEGVILEIDSTGLEDVRSFTLKAGDQTYEIFIADDVEYGFPLGHLQEHLSSNDPVAVDLEKREEGKLYALTIDDV